MLVLERVPPHPDVSLRPSQVLRLLLPPGDVVRFGRGRGCTVRTDGPGVQATLSVSPAGQMTLAFHGTMPAPDARTTKDAPHGLRVITPRPDEFFPDGRLKNRYSTLTRVTPSAPHALQIGETIVFTLHAGNRTCFIVREEDGAAIARAVDDAGAEGEDAATSAKVPSRAAAAVSRAPSTRRRRRRVAKASSEPAAKRVDPADGERHTLDEFIEAYGGSADVPPEQWLLAEMRVDAAEGVACALEHFLVAYGGTIERPPPQWHFAGDMGGNGSTRRRSRRIAKAGIGPAAKRAKR